MEWNVYRENINEKKIEVYNVFDHYYFKNDVLKLKKKKLNIKDFSENLKHIAMYYFWSKCEYEVVITSFPPRISERELNKLTNEESIYRHYPILETRLKIDIYQQLELNWDKFIEYVYNFKKVK